MIKVKDKIGWKCRLGLHKWRYTIHHGKHNHPGMLKIIRFCEKCPIMFEWDDDAFKPRWEPYE